MGEGLGSSRGRGPPKALGRTREGRPGRWELSGGYGVHFAGTHRARGSNGCLVAIDGHIHAVWSLRLSGGRPGGDSRLRLSQTVLECGRIVVTAFATMGGRGRTTELDWLIVATPGAGWILTSVSHASMVKPTDGARRVGIGASLSNVSISPSVSTLGIAACREGKLDLAFLGEYDDASSPGRNVLGVDGDTHRSGLRGAPRISARVMVPACDNRGCFVVEDHLPEILEESFILGDRTRAGGREWPVVWRLGQG